MHSADSSFDYLGTEPAGQCDSGLVMAARQGSEAAFAELHRLYAPRLYRTIFSIVKNYEDAEDVLQETLMQAYLALGTFEGRSKLLSWLTRIAINSSLISLRKRRIRREDNFVPLLCCDDAATPIEVKDPGPSPEEICLQRERKFRTLNAIIELKPSLQRVLQFQVSRECSIKEIARSLDLSVTNVKSKLHRARKRLAKPTQLESRLGPPRARTRGQMRQGTASR